MMKLLLLLCVAVVGGDSALNVLEYRIELDLKAGKVSLHLTPYRKFDPEAVMKVSILSTIFIWKLCQIDISILQR